MGLSCPLSHPIPKSELDVCALPVPISEPGLKPVTVSRWDRLQVQAPVQETTVSVLCGRSAAFHFFQIVRQELSDIFKLGNIRWVDLH